MNTNKSLCIIGVMEFNDAYIYDTVLMRPPVGKGLYDFSYSLLLSPMLICVFYLLEKEHPPQQLQL